MHGKLERYLEELQKWGALTNLVGSTDRDALQVHVDDALAAVPALPRDARVVDLGSGAGFPGLPLLIARPDLRLTLVEIREKRVHFLRHVVRTLGLDCEVLRARLEEPPTGSGFEHALIRGVAPLPRVLELATPWVCSDGQLWLWTREDPSPAVRVIDRIPLGERGHILRILAE